MGQLLSTEVLELFLVFVVPGFIAMKVHDLLVPADNRSWMNSLIEVVSYSMLNLALLFWLVQMVWREGFRQEHGVAYWLGLYVVVFIAPVGWAVLVYSLRASRWLRRYMLHPSPTAWDFFFARRRPVWVLCHLKSGEMLGGLFSDRSSASSYPRTEDLYLEEIWRVDEGGRFLERIEQTAGVLVRREECTHIEFFATSKGAEDDEADQG